MSDESRGTQPGDFIISVGEVPISTAEAYLSRVKDVSLLLSGREISEVYLTCAEGGLFQFWLVFADGSSYEFGSLSPIEVMTSETTAPLEELPRQSLISFEVDRFTDGRSELVLYASGGVTCRLRTSELFHLDAEDRPDNMALPWLALGGELLLHVGEYPEESSGAD